MPFYTKKRIVVASYKGELEMGAEYEDAKDSFITHEEFAELFTSTARVVAVVSKKRLIRIEEAAGDRVKVLGLQGERYLIANY